MPRHSSTATLRRIEYLAALVTAAFVTAGAISVVADEAPAAQVRTITEPSQLVGARYFDIEANRAASIRALGGHLVQQRATSVSRYDDIEANKARNQRRF